MVTWEVSSLMLHCIWLPHEVSVRVLAPGAADWAEAHCAVIQEGFFFAASRRCCSRGPPACFPQPSVCLPHSDHSHRFIELAPEKTFVSPARASVKKLDERLTPPVLFLPTPVIFFSLASAWLLLLLLALFRLIIPLLLLSFSSSSPCCRSSSTATEHLLLCLSASPPRHFHVSQLHPSLPCHYMLMYTLFRRVTAA